MNEGTQDVIVTIKHGDEETTVKGEFCLCIVEQDGSEDGRGSASVLFTGGTRITQSISCLATGCASFLADVVKKQMTNRSVEPGTNEYERYLNFVFKAFQEVFKTECAEYFREQPRIPFLKRMINFLGKAGKSLANTTAGDAEDEDEA